MEKISEVKRIPFFLYIEAAVQRCSWEKMFWKYAEFTREHHAEVRFQ